MTDVVFTVDLEPDCPPFLEGWRGMEEGAPALLDVLAREGVPATFFTTGEAAERFPGVAERLRAEGHELGCHGHTHRAFPELSDDEARREIERSTEILRAFGPVTAFRAPYLRLPDRHLPLLEEAGYEVDASLARYKPAHWRPAAATPLRRIRASVTSSVLRLPGWIRDPWLASRRSPVVLFVHPWEFVDLTREPIRWDCRFRTGLPALEAVTEVLGFFRQRGASFRRLDDAPGEEERSGSARPT